MGLQPPLYAEGERIQILVLQAAGQTAGADLQGTAAAAHEGRRAGPRKLRVLRLPRRRLPALPQARPQGESPVHARHRTRMALFVHRLSAGRRGSETADRQPTSHLPAARRGAVQPRLAHARTQTHLPAAPQPGLLLFPSRIHGVPGRHDRRPTAGRPAPEPPAERSAGGPHALPRGRRHGPPDQHQTRPCGYAAPAGRDRHRPAAAENPPPGPVPRPDAPARASSSPSTPRTGRRPTSTNWGSSAPST